jgi:hypothetical protein
VERSSDVNLVVMSDVIYAPALHGVLFATLRDIAMVFPAAVFIMSVEARRQEERGFFDLLRESGWGYRKVKVWPWRVLDSPGARGLCGVQVPEGLVSMHPSGGNVAIFHLAPRAAWG